MAKIKQTDSLIHELRLNKTPHDLSVLNKRLDTARQIYNACLGEGLKRLLLVKQSKPYQQAIVLPQKVRNNKNQLIVNYVI
jgi:hypothetical protein